MAIFTPVLNGRKMAAEIGKNGQNQAKIPFSGPFFRGPGGSQFQAWGHFPCVLSQFFLGKTDQMLRGRFPVLVNQFSATSIGVN